MPIFNYQCKCKNLVKKFHRLAKDAPATLNCEKCGQEMEKLLSAPSSSSKIVIDNGVQAKAVEIIPNIIELNEERSKKNYRED